MNSGTLAANIRTARSGNDGCDRSVGQVRLSLHSDLGSIEKEWKSFEQSADCTAFQSFDWLAAWQRHIGSRAGIKPCVVSAFDDEDRLLFVFPLAIHPGRVARLTWLGSELCDYNAPLLAPDFQLHAGESFAALWERALRQITAAGLRFDLIHFEKMPEIVGKQPNPFLQLSTGRNPSAGYVTLLTGNWEQFYEAKRSASRRKGDRNRLKRLASYGEVRLVCPETPEEKERTVQKLLTQKSWAFERMGVADLFLQPGYREFFAELALQRPQLCHVSRLEAGRIWAATNFGLTFRDSYYHVLCSYEQRAIAAFGPGGVHLRELMRFAQERGFDRFDFTIGDEPYKREWSDIKIGLHDYTAARTFRSWPQAAAMGARRYLKRSIKQNRHVWRAFIGARQLFAMMRARFDTRPAGGRRFRDDASAQQTGQATRERRP